MCGGGGKVCVVEEVRCVVEEKVCGGGGKVCGGGSKVCVVEEVRCVWWRK